MKHIFISYSPRDNKQMVVMRDQLMRIGYKPWIDPNPRPGQDWRFEIDDAIRAADALLLVVTPSAMESIYITYEWSLAIGSGVPVIPVIFTPTRMHPRLTTLEHFDSTGFTDPGHFWNYFSREIQRILNVAPQPGAIRKAPPPPAPRQAPPPQKPQAPPQPGFNRAVMPKEPGFYLVIRRGPELNKMFLLAKENLTLGRDANNDIVIEDSEISRQHLRVLWKGNGYAVQDLGSTNGTRINGGERIQGEVALQPGQALMLGDAIILSYEAISGSTG